MYITSAKFLKGLVSEDESLEDQTPQVALIGRSNVGKSSVINAITGQKDLAKTSSFPGRTQQINLFLLSVSGKNKIYLLDLPGYGYAKASKTDQARLQTLIHWYLFGSHYAQKKVVLIIDSVVGITETDFQMLHSLEQEGKNVIIVANKIDKLKKNEVSNKLKGIREAAGDYKIIPLSAKDRLGISELINEMFS
jgi:GTP-binding protein